MIDFFHILKYIIYFFVCEEKLIFFLQTHTFYDIYLSMNYE